MIIVNDEVLDTFQKKLKDIRKRLKYDQKRFGEKVGLSNTTICYLETGKIKMSKSQYFAIMYVLGHWSEIA